MPKLTEQELAIEVRNLFLSSSMTGYIKIIYVVHNHGQIAEEDSILKKVFMVLNDMHPEFINIKGNATEVMPCFGCNGR